MFEIGKSGRGGHVSKADGRDPEWPASRSESASRQILAPRDCPPPPNSKERTSTLAPRSGRRSASPSASRKVHAKISASVGAAEAPEPDRGEIAERAARLGITAER